jgi:hypothetical protein
MKRNIIFILLLFFGGFIKSTSAQTPATAYDFTMNDCNGQMHHLFSELDSGNVVVMEFFMLSCSPCIVAGHALDEMVVPLKKKYGEKVKFYQTGFTNSYTCTQIQSWRSTNGFNTSVPFDSGAVQVAYYGGMGMPTVVVVGGKDHKVLFSSMDFQPASDTATISKSIHAFFDPTGISTTYLLTSSISAFPNPASSTITLSFELEKPETFHLSILNMQGQKIADLLTTSLNRGTPHQIIELPVLENGIYFLQGDLSGNSFTKKITILNQ